MIRFAHPAVLWLLLLVPLWMAAVWYILRQRRRAAERFVGPDLLERIAYSISPAKLKWKSGLWLTAWALLVLAAADPQVGTKLEEVKREGIDIVIALDLSTSMLCEDIPPSRLENARHEIQKFVEGLKGDRVGLVAFAGTAVIHCPLTTDYGAVKLLTRVMTPSLIPEPGTALADAIDKARRAFNDEDAKSRVIILITDGEDHEEQAVEAAREAGEEGIRIYTIGMGTPGGAPIPVSEDNRAEGFKKSKDGQIVVTKLNQLLLQRIADAGNGQYLPGTKGGEELETIWEEISAMEKREFEKKQYTGFEDRFQYLALPAVLLLLFEFLLSERRGLAVVQRLRSNVSRKRESAL